MSALKGPTLRPSSTGVTHAALGRRGAVVPHSSTPPSTSTPAAPGGVPARSADGFAPGLPAAGALAPVGDAASEERGFAPGLSAADVEGMGALHATVHLVKLMHHQVTVDGLSSAQAAEAAARMLAAFTRPETARAVARELDRMPIYAVYPLQVQMALMDVAPALLPGFERGSVVENRRALAEGGRVMAGHATQVQVPTTFTVTSLALMTPGEPGFAFEPLRRGVFRLLVDTPGRYDFALRAVMGERTVVDTFTVDVSVPGRRPPRGA